MVGACSSPPTHTHYAYQYCCLIQLIGWHLYLQLLAIQVQFWLETDSEFRQILGSMLLGRIYRELGRSCITLRDGEQWQISFRENEEIFKEAGMV